MAYRDMRRSRVLVAAAGLFLFFAVLWLRVAWLQIAQHDHFEKRATRNHEQRVLVKPTRGAILDRSGRPLARDLQTYSIHAVPREMENSRQTAADLARILDLDRRALERRFAERPKFVWVDRQVPPDRAEKVKALAQRGIHMSPEVRRDYALGAAACELVGRTDVDNTGVEGLELQFDDVLRGRAGWITRFIDGLGRAVTLPGALSRDPTDGHHVLTTIDADVQAVLETHLARAVDTLRADRGFGIILDPRTGEILAAASAPHLGPGKGRAWPFTDQYEPGSTYKIVIAAAALEEGITAPDQWIEGAEDGVAKIAPGAVFRDVHKEARFRMRDAVRWSSNIVMGRLALMLGNESLYQYSTAMGFGSITGLTFPGEAGGTLRSPARWSGRSAPTIAIGYEVSVTALQLALAYGAIANGGHLMQPLLVREIRSPEGGVVKRFHPHAAHRVFSDRTSRTMRELLAAVVDSGTAKAARVPGLHVAGKTGTARKYDFASGQYQGRYIASFAGFAPADAPTLVGVIVIDEPRGRKYYGGDVAAPIFREVVKQLGRMPQTPLQWDAGRVAMAPPQAAPVTVPDLRLLRPEAVRRTVREAGLRVRFAGKGERALAQVPRAGEAAERGARVTVWLEPPADSTGRHMPDLAGLAVREAMRRLGSLEVTPRIHGSGTVVRQRPAAGEPLPDDRAVELWCEARTALTTSRSAGVDARGAAFGAGP